ncbi:hypothetical protein EDD15DRAFT_2195219 [Pisolithus albus]|nr:hypothetical protein EDD15DRAFT_2195219 [Pisolithus albus]
MTRKAGKGQSKHGGHLSSYSDLMERATTHQDRAGVAKPTRHITAPLKAETTKIKITHLRVHPLVPHIVMGEKVEPTIVGGICQLMETAVVVVEMISENFTKSEYIVAFKKLLSKIVSAASRREYAAHPNQECTKLKSHATQLSSYSHIESDWVSAVMGEKCTSFMPHYQIPKTRLLRREMHMSLSQFSEFMSLIRSAAKRHLNCGLRPEEQDPDDLQQFMRMANKTGAPFKRNCQVTVRAYREPKKSTKRQRLCERNANNGMIKRVYPLQNRVSVVIKKFRKKSYVIPISDSESDADSETGAGPLSSFSPAASPRAIVPLCTDPVLDFLSSVRPSLAQFHNYFVKMGFVDDNALKAFFSWPADVQESMVRTELGQLMNPLQLHGLFVAIRARLESTTQTGYATW